MLFYVHNLRLKRLLPLAIVAGSFVFSVGATPNLNLAASPTTKIGLSPWWAPKDYWLDRIKRQLETIEASSGQFDLVFIGDSITHNWEGWPEEQWQEIIARPGVLKKLPAGNRPGWDSLEALKREFSVLNLGIGGDTTGEVIWRMRYGGQLKGYEAKCICLMIGTNNREEDPRAVADGIKTILREIRVQQPKAVVLLLPIFPRGEGVADPRRIRNEAVNGIIREFADGKNVVWVDFIGRFVRPDGVIPRSIMPDLLHPSAEGYAIWAEEILPHVRQVCKSKTANKKE